MRRTVALLVCVLALAGCSAQFQQEFNTGYELGSEGYEVNSLSDDWTGDHHAVSVDLTLTERVPTEADLDEVAEIIWTEYPGEIDELRIDINDELTMTATSAELAERFGERPAGLVPEEEGVSAGVVVAVVLAALLLAGLLVLVWWRGRRTPPPVAPPLYQPMGNPYQQYPYQQPTQNPYQQPTQNPYQQPAQNPYQQPAQNPYQQPAWYPHEQPAQYPYQQAPQDAYPQPVPEPSPQPPQEPPQEPPRS